MMNFMKKIVDLLRKKPKQQVSAAVAYIQNKDGKILVVWNKRYGRWGLAGGRIEENETPEHAVTREIYEETGLVAKKCYLRYEGAHEESVASTRGSYIYFFEVIVHDKEPKEMEPGCPVTWFWPDEFMRWGLARKFYSNAFRHIHHLNTY